MPSSACPLSSLLATLLLSLGRSTADHCEAATLDLLQRQLSLEASEPPKEVALLQSRSQAEVELAEIALWNGEDAVPDWYMEAVGNVEEKRPDESLLQEMATEALKKARIVGMFDSGTNLMVATVKKNFPGVKIVEPLWKHSVPEKHLKNLTSDTLLIEMVRSPIAQIDGWRKAPYDLNKCVFFTKNSVMKPCRMPDGHTYRKGVTEVWNSYTGGYLRANNTNTNVAIIQYEDLVMDPDTVVRRIASLMRLPTPKHFTVVKAPAKNHGHPRGRELAMQNIRNMKYMHSSSRDHISQLCKLLNRSLMQHFEVHMPKKAARLYADDCAGA